MNYKLPDHGFAKFLLHRGKKKLGKWMIPGKSIELDAFDLAELRKIGIHPIQEQTPKPRARVKSEIVSPAVTVAPVSIQSEPAGSTPEREASREEKPAEIEADDMLDLDGDELE